MAIFLLVASTDEQFREMIRENLVNQPNAKITSEYTEVASNYTSACCRIWKHHPEAALVWTSVTIRTRFEDPRKGPPGRA